MTDMIESGDVIRCFSQNDGKTFCLKVTSLLLEGGQRKKYLKGTRSGDIDPVTCVEIPYELAHRVCELMAQAAGRPLGEGFADMGYAISYPVL